MRRSILLLACVICLPPATTFAATVDPPMRVKVTKLDRSEAAGMITSYDEDGFELMDNRKQTQTIKWDELPPNVIMNLHQQLVRKGTGEQWLKLGEKLLTMPGGRAPAERALQRAERTDPNLKGQVEEARKKAKLTPPPRAEQRPDARVTEAGTGGARGDEQPETIKEPKDPAKPVVGPQQVGLIDPSAWGEQTPEQFAAAVAELKAFADQSARTLNLNLPLYETQFFLLYSDLSPAEGQKWAGVLDRTYGRLAQLFGVQPNQNVWRGKALVFIFARDEDYLNFQMKMHDGTMAAGTDGMCHTFGNGHVHVAFFRQPNELDFAHVLVHETAHGFLHRYRSPVPIPSWINEGLAEAIAGELVRRPGTAQEGLAEARAELQRRKNLDDFFDREQIVAWQYPVARTLTEFMIRQSKQGYVDFVDGIKDGMSWEDALREKYGVTLDQLVNAYGISMTVAGLQPSR